MRVLAAMSGGVDSAVAAARAVDAGHDVTGVHLALAKNPQSFRSGARGLLLARGRPRRPAGRRRAGHPVLRLGPVRPVRGRRGGRLRGRVRRRPHPQPVPAVQREDQVRGRAGPGPGPGLRRRVHRPLRAAGADRPRGRAAPGRRRGQGPVLRARGAHPGPAAALALPPGHLGQARRPGRGPAARPGRGREAGQPRHLLRRRRRHRRVPDPAAGPAGRGHRGPGGPQGR